MPITSNLLKFKGYFPGPCHDPNRRRAAHGTGIDRRYRPSRIYAGTTDFKDLVLPWRYLWPRPFAGDRAQVQRDPGFVGSVKNPVSGASETIAGDGERGLTIRPN